MRQLPGPAGALRRQQSWDPVATCTCCPPPLLVEWNCLPFLLPGARPWGQRLGVGGRGHWGQGSGSSSSALKVEEVVHVGTQCPGSKTHAVVKGQLIRGRCSSPDAQSRRRHPRAGQGWPRPQGLRGSLGLARQTDQRASSHPPAAPSRAAQRPGPPRGPGLTRAQWGHLSISCLGFGGDWWVQWAGQLLDWERSGSRARAVLKRPAKWL